MSQDIIYLDYASATPVSELVIEAMLPYMSELFYNPSSPYTPAVAVRRDLDRAKSQLASSIGAKADDLIMTAGATESINLMFAQSDARSHVITTSIEHPAVLESAKSFEVSYIAPDKRGSIDPVDVASAIRPNTTLVSVQLANNEIGTIQPLRQIAEVVVLERQRRFEAGETTPIYFHSDASQGAGLIDINVARLGVDALTLNSAKVYGPKQVGLLWLSSRVKARPLIAGGGQERGLRSGTENVAGVIGFARALEIASKGRNSQSARLAQLRDSLQSRLVEAFPEAVVSGNQKKRLANFLHISFPGIDGERLVFLLEARGVLVATGSACSANKGTASHVLEAIGLADELIGGSVRITLGRSSDEANIDQAFCIIREVVELEKKRLNR